MEKKTISTVKQVDGADPGLHKVNVKGLYLKVTDSGTKSWIYRFQIAGKRRDMGLGRYPATGLAAARAEATAHAALVEKGIDPISQRDAAKALEVVAVVESARKSITLRQAVADYVEVKGAIWRSDKHRIQWERTIAADFGGIIDKPVGDITVEDIELALKPVWTKRPESSERLIGRIVNVIDYAKAKKWRDTGASDWTKHLLHVLPAVPVKSARIKHFASMPYADLPTFWKRLTGRTGTPAAALQLLILCGSRSGEVRGARAQEFDLDAGLWIIPAERMKAGREHRQPLSRQAIELVRPMLVGKAPGDLVFPGTKASTIMHDMTLGRQIEGDYTVHGFRSSFRDWVGEETDFDGIAAELCLAHARRHRCREGLPARRHAGKAPGHPASVG